MCRESGAKSVLYVNFRFQKVMVKEGVHNKGVAARLVMSVFGTDSSGKKIINKEYKAVSEGYADLIKSSNWDKEKVLSLFPDLEDKVISHFLADYALSGDKDSSSTFKATAIKVNRPIIESKQAEAASDDQKTESLEDALLAEKKATAKKLLERGMSVKEASEITGLSEEEIAR